MSNPSLPLTLERSQDWLLRYGLSPVGIDAGRLGLEGIQYLLYLPVFSARIAVGEEEFVAKVRDMIRFTETVRREQAAHMPSDVGTTVKST